MGQSLSAIYIHLIFSTRGREPALNEDIQPRLWQYLGGICSGLGCIPVQIGGTCDHVHLLIILSRHIAIMDLVSKLKAYSTNWLKTVGYKYQAFNWQTGYGAFSVNPAECDKVVEYISNQKQHHEKRDFCDELRLFLKKYSVDYNEKYLCND